MYDIPDAVVFQCLPDGLENLLHMVLTVWDADKMYIIAFLLFVVFYCVCDKRIKRRVHR